jgi:hypothetical protein
MDKTHDLLGISDQRLKAMMDKFKQIMPKDKPYGGTAELIEIIAKERTYSRKELVYMGMVLAATYQNAEYT